MIQCCASVSHFHPPHHPTVRFVSPKCSSSKISAIASSSSSSSSSTRRTLSISVISTSIFSFSTSSAQSAISEFFELENSGGVKSLDLRIGYGDVPADGDQVAVHYYGRLAAKQGWRFDSTYDHKDETGEPTPFVFTLGSGKVISGIEAAVKSMKVGGIRRVVIPPSQGYQNTSQEPLPPNFFDRQRLFTTIFNPTRLANGEGSTLGTLIFDIELGQWMTSQRNPSQHRTRRIAMSFEFSPSFLLRESTCAGCQIKNY